MNYVDLDPALNPLIKSYLEPADRKRLAPVLTVLGADAAQRLAPLADVADKNPPTLAQFDREGDRVDEIDYHASYQELQRAAYEEYGLSALSHRGMHGWDDVPPHLVKYILSYVFVQAEFGLACPVSMTDAAARTLRKFGEGEEIAEAIDRLISADPDQRFTGAMFMTEIQAGTDIAQTETVAESDGENWKLSGRKWFASNPDADIILTLARYPGGDDSTRGVGLFMLPKHRPDGSKNSYVIDRLKDKLGTRSMPSGEVTLDGAYAVQVGELDRGFRQMAEMVNTSRLSNAMRSTALMRRSLNEALAHARKRVVFGKTLIEAPLMRMTLLPLQAEAEAALGLVFYAGDMLQRGDAGDAEAAAQIRVLTPLAKHYICKRARFVTGETMEVRGGRGYIEEWPDARLVRDSHLGSIWEGSSNVIALDVLRCMRKQDTHRLLAQTMSGKLDSLTLAEAGPEVRELLDRWSAIVARGDGLLSAEKPVAEALIGNYADELAQLIMGTLLLEQAEAEATRDEDYRKLLAAKAFIAANIVRDDTTVARLLPHFEDIVDGTRVSRDSVAASTPTPVA
ncbi:MAG: acyl-CoA dehydrogenase family protein [Brevibacterium aurantiacum]|uniref:Acyl-CoA dehydrogenase n=1 Tax=Brevibacterium aurantiacum TaxID=273384 RepID=A0A2H1JLR3_BREAU|nr:acyl-CoA dehydrogenase family protein [Brevibacterium aurantiacum]MDN6175085.1 acyl-CoA dehydrogenase family protein [Brevibacterium sp.]AZT96214.1 acyl-CoA dehydrogenase [Brevibacterium aurantiacum]MDN6189456.1 acyl-CoA dehydrogenase family protein [Brevibacterium sp.]RCS97075.1 acyl-CoA dehydrogenase [Brevibacterium aurantiacum]SMX88042.1 Acyl-CoA dehydrogenase [Brevibacterium aurantiacum]